MIHRPLARRLVLSAGALALAGCDLIFPFSAGSTGAIALDAAVTLDAAVDAAGDSERGADGQSANSDAILPTAESTIFPLDTQPQDGNASTACSAGPPIFTWPGGKMVICSNATTSHTQCTAGSLCAAGWHLCDASEYLTRGGASVQPNTAAWLAACIKRIGAELQPVDGFCNGNCATATVPTRTVAWPCGGSTASQATSDQEPLGLLAAALTRTVGTDQPGNCAYWFPQRVNWPSFRAVCCN